MSNNLKNTKKIGYMTLLCGFLSLFWFLSIPLFTKTVRAVTVSDGYDFDDACINASTNPDAPTEIVLGANINNTTAFTVNNGQYLVINLNGKTLNLSRDICIDGSLKIIDSGDSGTINSHNYLYVSRGGIFTLEGGSLVCSQGCVWVNGSNSTFVMNGGQLNATGTGEGSRAVSLMHGGSFTQTDGTITGSVHIYESGGTYTQTGGTNPSNYTITFNANGGQMTSNSSSTATATTVTTSTGEKLTELLGASKDGCELVGWYTEATGGTAVTTSTVFTGNDRIYAHWAETPATYTITFDANGGTVSPTSGTTDASGKLSSLPTPTWSGHDFSGWFTAANGGTQVTTSTVFTGNDRIYAHWAETPSYHTVTYHVVNGKWNDTNTSGDRTETVANGQHPAHVPPVGSKPNAGYKAGSWDTNPSSATITGNTTFTYTYATNTSPSSSSKKSDDSDHHEESSSPSPEKPSWTPAKAAATIAAQKAQKQQAAASQLASIQTMLRTKTSDRAGTGRNVIDLDMTKVDILDPATVNLLLLNNRFAFNVKISVPGGLTTTIMIPANFNFRPFIKADGTMNIHEVLWWIISKKK